MRPSSCFSGITVLAPVDITGQPSPAVAFTTTGSLRVRPESLKLSITFSFTASSSAAVSADSLTTGESTFI